MLINFIHLPFFLGHVFHVTIPLVRTGEANEQPLDLMDNIVRKETPAIPQTPPEHLPMLSDKKWVLLHQSLLHLFNMT
jgi:hypothetical protein